ncbi:hypothetical protein H8R18_04290 [Nanchangia anserum]|uniref:hypothetical protein n=1 Tax=Nanchangia anserum TaxID=2692125 RepID=UPI00188336C2|nr:hypothetical protein [Nanchangia anserum]QOX82513.1 hypothetical protein H8R18_04290 [Nanchangia anserum]
MHRLPNAINLAFAVATVAAVIVASALDGDATRLVRMVCAGALFGLLFLLSNFVRGGFGMGDVKLAPSAFGMAAAASLTGLGIMTIVTFVGAGLAALILVGLKRATMSSALPMGPWIIPGLVAAIAAS